MIKKDGKLYPSKNYKYITDGSVFSTMAILGAHDDGKNWHDTNEEPPIDEEEAARRREEAAQPPTFAERLEAQITYTAMMTDTLLED